LKVREGDCGGIFGNGGEGYAVAILGYRLVMSRYALAML